MQGILVLEDGHFYQGRSFSENLSGQGEVVFNTSPTGYQEILTDPSYAGQIVVLTTSHVGNYGVNPQDVESTHPRAAGLLVRDYHPAPSNWRSARSLASYLQKSSIPALTDVDTRALVLHIREGGALRGVIQPFSEPSAPWAGKVDPSSNNSGWEATVRRLVEQARTVPSMNGRDLASTVSCHAPHTVGSPDSSLHVVAMDFGIKHSILRQLNERGCRVTVVPATTTAAEVLALSPRGVLLSNGPGDPEPVRHAVKTIQGLLGQVPIFGICLGHQLLALACGGATYKLPFGHRGGNHPVRELHSGRVEMTAQNHGFAVRASSLDGRQVMVTHVNLNDDTVEGLRHRRLAAFSVQFHPEAAPGPHDSHHLFGRFVNMMEAVH